MRLTKLSLACLVLGGSVLLTACGGGGGGGSGSALTLNGTAAVGAPLAGPVSATCKTGTGTATSNADGSFTVVVNNGVGPCLLSITANGVTMSSITSGSGATQTANITPMTNMLVNYLRSVPGMEAADPAAWFALPSVRALLADTAALTARVVNDFIPALKALMPAGTTLSVTSASFLSTAFVASPTGSSTDADLEKLKTAGVVTSTGAPTAATTASLKTAASNDTAVVTPTGATGAGS
ncbi:hypothetical protein LP417_31630 [Polaromonas sp. P1-6]|nr:hypothetical protein LP417_31630 [Polaromonas sp. P1-6]